MIPRSSFDIPTEGRSVTPHPLLEIQRERCGVTQRSPLDISREVAG